MDKVESSNKSMCGIPTDAHPKTLRDTKTGKGLYWAGLLGITLAAGMAIGFHAADLGVRWLPTMIEIILVICIMSLWSMVCGHFMHGSATVQTDKGRRLRKRVTTCIVLLALALTARLAVFTTQKRCDLTSLKPADFNKTFQTDLQQLRYCDQGLEKHLNILTELKEQIGTERILNADEEKLVRSSWRAITDYTVALEQIKSFYSDWFKFDSSRTQRSYHLRSFFMYYTADLVLYEKSMRFVSLINNNDNAIKFLDSSDPQGTYGKDTFSNFRDHFQGIDDVTRVTAGKVYMLSANKTYDAKELLDGLGCGYLWHKTETELALIESVSTLEMASLSVNNATAILKGVVDKVWFPAQKGVAQWMGNTRIRRIGQYLITKDQREKMDTHLQPGDILISRKNWYLSNVGLPGFWPHAILYLGDSEKFETYFDIPEVCHYLTELTGETITLGQYLAGKYPARYRRYTAGDGEPYRVIEGISHGVVLNTFKGAFGDYMAALRPRLDKKAKAQAIIEAFGHLDKPYDYDFDFATDDALVCTELVWRSYRPARNKQGIDFSLVEIGGRKTMPANQIVILFAEELSKDSQQLDFVYFLDASEEDRKAFEANQNAFIQSSKRQKWSFSPD